jgi:hypothetical protein
MALVVTVLVSVSCVPPDEYVVTVLVAGTVMFWFRVALSAAVLAAVQA